MLLRLLSLRMHDVVRTFSFFLFPQTSSAIQLKFPLSSAETLWIPLLRCAASSVSTSSSCSAKYHSFLFLGQMCRNFNQMLSGPVVFRIFVALAFTDVKLNSLDHQKKTAGRGILSDRPDVLVRKTGSHEKNPIISSGALETISKHLEVSHPWSARYLHQST